MLSRLKSMFLEKTPEAPAGEDQVRLAAAALLVEAAEMDGHLHEEEHGRIHGLLRRRFGLSEEEAAELMAQARAEVAEAVQLVSFTRAIKDHCSLEQRVEILEMLWEVVYADGELHDYEANLIRRVAGLLYVPDRDSGEARKRAMARLGIDPSPS